MFTISLMKRRGENTKATKSRRSMMRLTRIFNDGDGESLIFELTNKIHKLVLHENLVYEHPAQVQSNSISFSDRLATTKREKLSALSIVAASMF